jgi:hypothetical protein
MKSKNTPEKGDAILKFFNNVVRDVREYDGPLDENFSGFYPTGDNVPTAG